MGTKPRLSVLKEVHGDMGSYGAEDGPLAEAKMSPPRQRRGLINRHQVSRILDAGDDAALTLVAAPAGYGKTTAVRAWCAGRPAPLVWVTLDVGDNDSVRLWRYVATALDRVRHGLGRRALRRLTSEVGGIISPIDELLNGISEFGDELVIVLDDLQAVTDDECLGSIDYALDHLPTNAHLILITRVDPALRLAQMRARGSLAEVRAVDLAFTEKEAYELLVQRSGLELDGEEVRMLRQRTEGWPAALFLAAYWLRTVDDAHLAVREFGGDHRFVADYLSREVINSLDADTRWFLLRASVLRRFTAELCDAVFGRNDSAAVLDQLEHSNYFVTRLEHGGWFRVHPLFAEFAEAQLNALRPDHGLVLHRRAAVWLRSRGRPVESLEHAAAAREHEFMADLLVEYHLRMIRTGSARALLRWVQTLPDRQVVTHPEVAVGAATAALMIGHSVVERRRLLDLARRAQVEQPMRFSPYVQCVAAMVRAAAVDRNVGVAVLEGRAAVALGETDADESLLAAFAGLARALYLAGELDEAWAVALRAIGHPDADRRVPGHAFARSTLALVAAERGRCACARGHAEKARSLVGDVASSRTYLGANASAALGVVLAEEGKLAEAEHELAYSERFFHDEVATVHHAWILCLLARVRCRRGRLDEAEAAIGAVRDELHELSDAGRVPTLAAAAELEMTQARCRADGGHLLVMPSRAEIAVLGLLGSDLSARQIASKLFLSTNTVRSHTRSIYRKLGVNSRAGAVARAEQLGLFERADQPA